MGGRKGERVESQGEGAVGWSFPFFVLKVKGRAASRDGGARVVTLRPGIMFWNASPSLHQPSHLHSPTL